MLLKTIITPSPVTLHVDLESMTADQAIQHVGQLKEDFLAGKGIRPVVSHESVKQLGRIYDLYRVCHETKQIGDFAGDMNLPHNCVAVLIHKNNTTDSEIMIEYITSDVEAYIISDAGVTVTVINGKKAVDEKNLKGAGHYRHPSDASHVTIHGGNVKIDSPHVNIHQGVGGQHTSKPA